MKKYFTFVLFLLMTASQIVNAQDTLLVHLKAGSTVSIPNSSIDSITYKADNISQLDTLLIHKNVIFAESTEKIDSITFNNPRPILAEWDFPVVNGTVNLAQTSGTLAFGSFTGFNANLSADSNNGVIATGTLWDVNDPGIGIILQFTSPKDFSAVTTVTFTVKVENPPVTGPGIMAYVQNGATLNWAGDYSFWRTAPITEFYTYTYNIDKTASGLDIAKIVSFRIKANGTGISGTNCGTGGTCAIVRVKKVVMQ